MEEKLGGDVSYKELTLNKSSSLTEDWWREFHERPIAFHHLMCSICNILASRRLSVNVFHGVGTKKNNACTYSRLYSSV